MPTKRKRIPRKRVGQVSMHSLTIEQLLSLGAGWHPPKNEFELRYTGWQTWKDFMAIWLVVRNEYLAHETWGHNVNDREGIFAERVYQTFGAKGPPTDATYDDIRAAIAANEDIAVVEIWAMYG